MPARLVVSLSGLSDGSPQSIHRARAFIADLAGRGVPVSLLFRPCESGGVLGPRSRLARFMHERSAAGDAIVLHGYDHAADPTGAGRLAHVGRRAEFAALPRHEATLRLTAARRALAVLDLRTEVFVPPRWLASSGTVEALPGLGFRVLADENGIRSLDGDGPTVRARLLGFRASGEQRGLADDRRAPEAWRCRLFVAEVGRTARRGGLVRINVRAKDLKRPLRRDGVLAAVDAALALGGVPGTYGPTPPGESARIGA
jgi:predicted deacetylase